MKIISITVSLTLLLVLFIVTPVSAGYAWEITTVDGADDVGMFSSLAFSPAGYPAISYYDDTHGELKYAIRDAGTWIPISVTATVNDVGMHTSLAFNGSTPAISYFDQTSRALKYTWKNTSGWYNTTIDSDPINDVGIYSSLAFNGSYPAISYQEGGVNDNLKYAWKNINGWHNTTIDSSGDVGSYTSLAFNGSYPAISYYHNTNDYLKYAWMDNGGVWHVEPVDYAGSVGRESSLAFNGSYPAISYYNESSGDLKYAWKDLDGWHTVTVDSTDKVGLYTSLAFDASGYPAISYCDLTYDALKYAWKDAGGWHTATVDSAGNVGSYTSLAFDAMGFPAISYYNASNKDLKYASAIVPLPPVADFTANQTAGSPPLTVQFTDGTVGVVDTWSWDFGDGDTSGDQNPVHTYRNPGIYDVNLTVSNGFFTDSLTKPAFMNVSGPFGIPLAAGWNLISIPVTGPNLTVPGEVTGSLYEYDPIGGSYATTLISALEPGKGYWVSATADCALIVDGTNLENYTATLSPGWNMIGALSMDTSFTNPETDPPGAVQNYTYAYDPVSRMYVSVTTLTPCSGYWASATADCTLNVSTT